MRRVILVEARQPSPVLQLRGRRLLPGEGVQFGPWYIYVHLGRYRLPIDVSHETVT